MLLTFNLMANINNNLNNNNNNNNDNNINAIDQNSQNTVTNTNAANQISVTILPIPGRRSFRKLRSTSPITCNKASCNDHNQWMVSLLAYYMNNVYGLSNADTIECMPYRICIATIQMQRLLDLENVISLHILRFGETAKPTASLCKRLFQYCA